MDVTSNDLLLIRELEETKYWVKVIHRLTGDLINEIPSMCDHKHNRVRKYPQNQDYAFESCRTCHEIYAHNINTGESISVHKESKIVRMCDGPAGSLLVTNRDWELLKLDPEKTQDKPQSVFVQYIPLSTEKRLLRFCYVECHDMFLYTVKDVKEDYELIALKLGVTSFSGGYLVRSMVE